MIPYFEWHFLLGYLELIACCCGERLARTIFHWLTMRSFYTRIIQWYRYCNCVWLSMLFRAPHKRRALGACRKTTLTIQQYNDICKLNPICSNTRICTTFSCAITNSRATPIVGIQQTHKIIDIYENSKTQINTLYGQYICSIFYELWLQVEQIAWAEMD